MKGRYVEEEPSWSYRQRVHEKIRGAKRFLDMETGGGEFLSSLQPLPEASFATEGYPPNVPVAKKRLEPIGLTVLAVESDTKLPFEDSFLDLVINRHGVYIPGDVYRVLCSGGYFLTQQFGGQSFTELHELLDEKLYGKATYNRPEWNLSYALNELKQADFRILEQKEEFPHARFYDVGALVYLLKAAPWEISDFTVDRYREQLREIHQLIHERGSLEVTAPRFFIEARKD